MADPAGTLSRKSIVERLEVDLVGPLEADEKLEGKTSRPSDVYLTGMLWPMGERMGGQDDDGEEGEDEDDQLGTSATVVGQQRPCSMGISFATSGSHTVSVTVRFATYSRVEIADETGAASVSWQRSPHEFRLDSLDIGIAAGKPLLLEKEDLAVSAELHLRTLSYAGGQVSTITLINRSSAEGLNRNDIEELTLFQTEITVEPSDGTEIVSRPPSPVALDCDTFSGALLYRECHEFATGHQCSAAWDASGSRAILIRTRWIPHAYVPAYREDGDDVFSALIESGFLFAEKLASADGNVLCSRLEKLPEAYRAWIEIQAAAGARLDGEMKATAERHIGACNEVCSRIQAGIIALSEDRNLLKAFRYANAAMALQHSWKRTAEGTPLSPLRWRPFQLAFLLLAAESSCRPDSVDRDILDLLWFPTGGGKTEAYLALVGMVAWYRRLKGKNPDDGAGNAVIMRYTLRLLTAQQFERAAAMILAMDLIRAGKADPRKGQPEIGKRPFSIGLWVGREATPNTFDVAVTAKGTKGVATPEQLASCPCCGRRTVWKYDEHAESVTPSCPNEDCSLGPDFGQWPVFTVDQDIYREKPTMIIGTIDKFAQLPFKKELAGLFGFGKETATDLIIQDELHLISGPLGSLAGLYETALDWLLRKGAEGRRPKVVGSTATIRKAAEQVRALFDRRTCQFPPPGISYDNSAFAVVDPDKPPRMYVAVTTAGRSAKFALQAVAGSLLQSGGPHAGMPVEKRDGYATLLCYFNSLRELGGAIVQMQDDVPDSIRQYAGRRDETERMLASPEELTSRVSQKEIVDILSRLKRRADDPDSPDIVLATNMVSVGIDVPRLGLMLVNGQTKTRSEYIQSTSRVGRSSFPGLVVSVLNAAKARDRSHYETFPSWHATIYRDVEATSVTPFASRARDKALKAVLVSMIRHSSPQMENGPDLENAERVLSGIVSEIERRIKAIDQREIDDAGREIDQALEDWTASKPQFYKNRYKPQQSLMQDAEDHARKIAAGNLPGSAWSVMNTMRSVEASTRFRMVEHLAGRRQGNQSDNGDGQGRNPVPIWRRNNG